MLVIGLLNIYTCYPLLPSHQESNGELFSNRQRAELPYWRKVRGLIEKWDRQCHTPTMKLSQEMYTLYAAVCCTLYAVRHATHPVTFGVDIGQFPQLSNTPILHNRQHPKQFSNHSPFYDPAVVWGLLILKEIIKRAEGEHISRCFFLDYFDHNPKFILSCWIESWLKYQFKFSSDRFRYLLIKATSYMVGHWIVPCSWRSSFCCLRTHGIYFLLKNLQMSYCCG